MAIFDIAFKRMITIEAGWTDCPHETYKGIDRRWHPTWEGWFIIDSVKKEIGVHNISVLNTVLEKEHELQKLIRAFYLKEFWSVNYSGINSQDVANYIFDKAVNMGSRQIHKIVQRALGFKPYVVDGLFGKDTLYHLNTWESSLFLSVLDKAVDNYYEEIAKKDPSKKKFLKGWKNR